MNPYKVYKILMSSSCKNVRQCFIDGMSNDVMELAKRNYEKLRKAGVEKELAAVLAMLIASGYKKPKYGYVEMLLDIFEEQK